MSLPKIAACIALFLFPLCLHAQIRFEKGYFISNEQVKTACEIRNIDWDDNPTSFRYRLPGSDEVLEAALREVAAFGIDGGATYVRALTKVDQSSQDVNQLSKGRNPEWADELVFLKELVGGETKLYIYKRGGVGRFYYQKGGGEVVPLVYKRYFDGNGNVATNFGFRQQLLNDLPCDGITQLQIERTLYRESDLTRFFVKYNTCMNPQAKSVAKTVRRDAFNLKITPGLALTMPSTGSFTFTGSNGERKSTIASFRVGLEGEYFAPFHKNKWSLLVEPSFQYYKFPLYVPTLKIDVNYWTLELPIGIRHHFYLSNKTRLFVNALYAWTLKETATDKENPNTDYRVIAGSGFAGGAGLAKGPFSVEARYYFNRSLYAYRARLDMDYSQAALILGYRFLSK